MTERSRAVEVGDVVQLDPEHCRWGPVLIVATQVNRRMVQGYFLAHGDDGQIRRAYVRAEHAHCVRIGRAEWFVDEGEG